MNEKIELPAALFNALAEYLSYRPYREVAGLLAEMAAIAQPKPAETKEKTAEEIAAATA